MNSLLIRPIKRESRSVTRPILKMTPIGLSNIYFILSFIQRFVELHSPVKTKLFKDFGKAG